MKLKDDNSGDNDIENDDICPTEMDNKPAGLSAQINNAVHSHDVIRIEPLTIDRLLIMSNISFEHGYSHKLRMSLHYQLVGRSEKDEASSFSLLSSLLCGPPFSAVVGSMRRVSNNSNTTSQQPPFYGRYTDQHALAGTPS